MRTQTDEASKTRHTQRPKSQDNGVSLIGVERVASIHAQVKPPSPVGSHDRKSRVCNHKRGTYSGKLTNIRKSPQPESRSLCEASRTQQTPRIRANETSSATLKSELDRRSTHRPAHRRQDSQGRSRTQEARTVRVSAIQVLLGISCARSAQAR
jgi:hypothetical protein